MDPADAASTIRVGLDTAASAVRLTSSRPFRVGAAGIEIETADVVVEAERAAGPAGWVFRVQVASYPARDAAVTARTALREELEEDVTLTREPATGRYALRIGSFSTESGAEAARVELVGRGFESAVAIREPGAGASITAFVLHPRDRGALRLNARGLTVIPASPEDFIEVDGSPYRGYLELMAGSTELRLVNVLALEEYLRGVVPAELSPDVFPEREALKAQAIAARTYAVKRLGEYEAEGFDICATPACQVYRGVAVERELSDEAVRETAGEILTYEGEPVEALYTSTCGGRTENAENVFTTPLPYLVSRACALERREPTLEARNRGPRALDAAALDVMGVAHENVPLTVSGVRGLLSDVVSALGQSVCSDTARVPDSTPVDAVQMSRLLADALCWARRTRFLMSPADARLVVGAGVAGLDEEDRFDLAYAIRAGLVRPPAAGIRPGAPLTREEVLGIIYRVVTRYGEPLLREGRLRSVETDRLTIEVEEVREVTAPLGEERFLYREIDADDGAPYYEPSLTLMPNDRVSFHLGASGVDLLVAHSSGASFDRSSRFSHWTVRRTAEELSSQVNAQQPGVGAVLDLRPTRYGQSGRLAELEIVGASRTVTVRGLAIRRVLGIRENLFFFDRQTDPSGAATGWVFTGRGWGHGVGLCQVGAYGMAAAGYDYRTILSHYYPGTAITGAY